MNEEHDETRNDEDVADNINFNVYVDNKVIIILNNQLEFLDKFKDVHFQDLYDAAPEDMIKCVMGSFKVIRECQEALIHQIRESLIPSE